MDAPQVFADVMDEWKAGIDAHDPARVAAVFTEDAVFQGLRPYGVGRATVADYYDSQPVGMTVTYDIRETRRPVDTVVFGYVAATFRFPDRHSVDVAIGVVLTLVRDGWQLAQYQASRV